VSGSKICKKQQGKQKAASIVSGGKLLKSNKQSKRPQILLVAVSFVKSKKHR